jgi:hypothetical protein
MEKYTILNKQMNDTTKKELDFNEKNIIMDDIKDSNKNIFEDISNIFSENIVKSNIIIVDDNQNNGKNSVSNNDNNIPKKNTYSFPEHYFIPEYMAESTIKILEIIEFNKLLNINFPYAETFMNYDYKIKKILRYMDAIKKDGNYVLDNLIKCNNSKCNQWMPEHCFIDKYNRIVKCCIVCRIHGRIKDKREQRKKSKEEWIEKNYDKCAMYWQNYRGRKIEEIGVDKYLENNAKTFKEWRNNNPEKVKISNNERRENINYHYQNYIRDANKKNINFELSFDEFAEIVTHICYYCGKLQDKNLNGIDKMDCNSGYIKDNCVSCCEMCNFMKGTLTAEIFLKRIEHILTYQGYIKGNLYPEYFANHLSGNYDSYEKRANKKNIEFKMTEEDYYTLILEDCYICGKKTDGFHINGIDRVNNENGYYLDNIEPCCGECNFMKNKFKLADFFDKLRDIKKYKLIDFEIINSRFKYQNIVNQRRFYSKLKTINNTEEFKNFLREKYRIKKEIYKNKNIVDEEQINNSKRSHLNKKSPEQIKEEARIRKQKQRERLKEKYGDEEYKKKRAIEIAEYRKKKKEDDNKN